MGVRFPSVFSTTQVNALPASSAETVVCTTPPITPPLDFAPIVIVASFDIGTGTGTISIQATIRRGTTTAGTIIGAARPHTIAAPNNALLTMAVIDTFGPQDKVQYSLTIVQSGATAAGNFTDLFMYAFSL